ncbi:hypothetical protein [Halalkalibacillus halophilus]|uniref:hypothetical protein n=1 Tax=Halalkalibacillus halophilus TaxID=392827 RepID=UPI000403125A|nr:hypothetical protein [Halalkalibacillus halophilus]
MVTSLNILALVVLTTLVVMYAADSVMNIGKRKKQQRPVEPLTNHMEMEVSHR